MRRYLVVAAILLCSFGLLWAGRALERSLYEPPPPPPPLPPEVVEVEVIKEIPVEVPGPERVVERVVWRTRTVEVPADVEEVVCPPEPSLVPLTGRVQLDATKYEGMKDDQLVAGWKGEAVCEVRRDGPWFDLVREPFDLTNSFAVTTRPPGSLEDQLKKWRAELRLGLNTAPGWSAGATFYRQQRWGWWAQMDGAFQREQVAGGERYQIAGGVAFSLGRK